MEHSDITLGETRRLRNLEKSLDQIRREVEEHAASSKRISRDDAHPQHQRQRRDFEFQRKSVNSAPKSKGALSKVFGDGGGKIILVFAMLVMLRLWISRKNDDSRKYLPKAYRNKTGIWTNHTFDIGDMDAMDGSVFTDQITELSTGLWNNTKKFKTLLSIKNETRRASVQEKTGSRLIVVPDFLSHEDCDALVDLNRVSSTDASADASHLGFLHAKNVTQCPHGSSSYVPDVVARVEQRIFDLTRIPTHHHEPGMAVAWRAMGTPPTTDNADDGVTVTHGSLHLGVESTPALVVTVVIFLSDAPDDIRGGDIYFPTFGRNDKRFRNITYDMLDVLGAGDTWHAPLLQRPPPDPSPVEYLPCASPQSTSCANQHRLTLAALRQCASVGNKRRSKRGVKTMRQGMAVVPIKGNAVFFYSRLRNGLPDPDMWHMYCPMTSTGDVDDPDDQRGIWMAIKHKVLPVTAGANSTRLAWDPTYATCTHAGCGAAVHATGMP